MLDYVTILFLTIFFIGGFGALAILGFTAFFVGRSRMRSARATLYQLADMFDLVNHSSDGALPELRGKVNGVEVTVDVVYQMYARSGSSIKSSVRAWTRVRAKLPSMPPVHIRSRHQRINDQTRDDYSIRQMGNSPLDQKYEFAAADDITIDQALPIEIRDALIDANPPVHVSNGMVSWMQVKFVRDICLLQNAVLSCASVAAAFCAHPCNAREPASFSASQVLKSK